MGCYLVAAAYVLLHCFALLEVPFSQLNVNMLDDVVERATERGFALPKSKVAIALTCLDLLTFNNAQTGNTCWRRRPQAN